MCAAAMGACEATHAPPASDVPAAQPAAPPAPTATEITTQGDPWDGFASTMLEAARAVVLTAQQRAHDPRWDCDDAAKDLRATSTADYEHLARFGPASDEIVVTGVDEVTLVSPAAREEDEADAGAVRWLILRGDVAVFPDKRVRWAALRSSFEALSPTPEEPAIRIKHLPVDIRPAFGDLIHRLTSPSCPLPILTSQDLSSLALSDQLQRHAVQSIARDLRRVPMVCADVASALGPWDASMGTLNAIVRAGLRIVDLRADLKMEGSPPRVCLGALEVREME